MKKRNSCKDIEQNFINPCMCCIKCEGISSFGRESQTGIVPCLGDLPCMTDTRILMGTCYKLFFVKHFIHKLSVCTVLCKLQVYLLVVSDSLNFYFKHFSNFFFFAVLEVLLMSTSSTLVVNPYPTALPYGNGMVLHFYHQQESSMTKTVHKVINKGLKTYV